MATIQEIMVTRARWYMNDRRFWFRNEADRIMFVLKWR
jgi:hypothetical protein